MRQVRLHPESHRQQIPESNLSLARKEESYINTPTNLHSYSVSPTNVFGCNVKKLNLFFLTHEITKEKDCEKTVKKNESVYVE